MLNSNDAETITLCGPGTPMGNLMRQYWIPAILSEELPAPDCAPVRIRVLNENLIAFRATSGKVGLIVDACPHRGASMFFGRNEEEGLRCVYHGWKFDTTGQCVDMMSEPGESSFKDKVRTIAYPTNERNGIIWAYLGPREVPPPLPDLEANMVADSSQQPRATLNSYNWLQALENNMDTAHNAILHHGAINPEDAEGWGSQYVEGVESLRYMVSDRSPRFEVRDTEYGCAYGCHRVTDDGRSYWRTMHWLFPFFTMSPIFELGSTAAMSATIPIDDEHCMSIGVTVRVGPGRTNIGNSSGGSRSRLPNTTDWLGRFRNPLSQEWEKDFGLDRDLQKAKPPTVQGFTGLRDINTQDEAMRWSQGRLTGGIVDRTWEHLGTSDAMIIRVRRRLLDAVTALNEKNTPPPAVDSPEVYRVRSGWITLPSDADWWEATRALREAFLGKEAPAQIHVS